MAVPAAPVAEAAFTALTAAEAALARAEEQAAALSIRLNEAEARLREVVGDVVVPDRAAVEAARRHRQALWDRVAAAAFGGAAPAPALALAYERAVAEADTLADRRAEESGLVERAALAARQVEEAQALALQSQARLDAGRAALDRAEAAWRAVLPAALPAGCRLEDLRAFAAGRTRVIERWEASAVASGAAAALQERHAGWARRLADMMPESAETALGPLLAAAVRVVADAAAAEKQAAEARAALRQLEAQHRTAVAGCAEAEAERVAWQADWARALAALGRPADEAPDTVEDILGVLGELDADLTQAAGLAARVRGMRADNARFVADVGAIVAAIGGEAPAEARAALAALQSLRRASAAAQAQAARRETLQSQVAQAERHVAELGRADALRRQDLDGVLAAAGAETMEDAELRLALAGERARQEAARAEAALRLGQDGDGVAEDVLRADLAALSAEDLARELYTAEAEADAARAEAERLAATVAVARRDLAQREAETGYADAVAAQNEAAAAAGRVLREALVAKLAACLLGSAMAVVEKQSSPAMLRAIGRWFSRLTAGDYSEVGVEQTGDGAALILTQAAFPHEPKQVGQLSEGTRDQLYLALRLAAIEAHPVALPFIADDILQTFDDARAEAALGALLDLSARTQVILLTHHGHLGVLAERAFPGRVGVVGLG